MMLVRFACTLALGCLALAAGCRPNEELPASADVTIQHDIRYREGPSRAWRLDLAFKNEPNCEPRPGLIIIHGGGWIEGDKSSFASKKYGVPGNIEEFAELGFVATTINYRLSGEAPFPAALEDCQCAVRWLRANAKVYNVDSEHIGVYGNSAGGHLALLVAMAGRTPGFEGDGPFQDQSSVVQAAVSDSGPLDLLLQYREDRLKQVVSDFLGGPPEGSRAALYRVASPANWITKGTPPLLLIYGGEDEQVPVQSADQFVADAGRAGLGDISYYRLASVGHCPYSLARVASLRSVVDEFFVRTLRRAGAAHAIEH